MHLATTKACYFTILQFVRLECGMELILSDDAIPIPINSSFHTLYETLEHFEHTSIVLRVCWVQKSFWRPEHHIKLFIIHVTIVVIIELIEHCVLVTTVIVVPHCADRVKLYLESEVSGNIGFGGCALIVEIHTRFW